MGCGRTLDEIIRWGDAEDTERLEILDRCRERKAGMKKSWPYDDSAERGAR
jgi:predicted Fe-S protein YdhL (DUF1289 family)